MNELRVTINGKEIELNDELKKMILSSNANNDKMAFDRVIDGKTPYYCITSAGSVLTVYDNESDYDERMFSVANYCTDKEKITQRCLHEQMNRLLWRYSESHGGDSDWDGYNLHWLIFYTPTTNSFRTDYVVRAKDCGTVYFKTKEEAENAISEVISPFIKAHPEYIP